VLLSVYVKIKRAAFTSSWNQTQEISCESRVCAVNTDAFIARIQTQSAGVWASAHAHRASHRALHIIWYLVLHYFIYEKSYSAAAAGAIELHGVIRRMATCEWNKAREPLIFWRSSSPYHMFYVCNIHLVSASTFSWRCYYHRHYTRSTTCLIMVHLSEWSARSVIHVSIL
jgi:hypothetical protein